MPHDDRHRVHHHVQLPGGRHIEVVYLDNHQSQTADVGESAQVEHPDVHAPVAAAVRTGHAPTTAPGEALHVCPSCAGALVHPIEWFEDSPGRWCILMRCPDCDLLREGLFGQALVERLDDELDKATGALLSDLQRLTHANMVEEIELFSRALELDLIGPNDF